MKRERRVLIADDEPLSREFLTEALAAAGFQVTAAETGSEAVAAFEAGRHDLVFTDLRMPQGDGLAVLRRVKALSPETPVVLVTAFGSVECAVRAMQEGAEDFILKPVAVEHIDLVLGRVFERERLRRENRMLKATLADGGGATGTAIGSHEAFVRCVDLARRVAKTKATVLIRGESGSGKEVVASILHTNGERRGAAFVKVNCAVLQDTLLATELFGHEKGAFTGAHQKKEGRFELADGGTLFLDEIGEISPEIQAKLLRVLESGEFERVGGKDTLRVDVRVVCATNRNLEEMIAAGKFREDLFYRLNVVPIAVPALRERGNDVLELADHFLARYAREFGGPARRFSAAARTALASYGWPGNVRELANVVQRTVLLCQEPEIGEHHLGLTTKAPPATADAMVGKTIADVEKTLILGTLTLTRGNKTRAAEILGVTARTLSNKLKIYRSAKGKAPEAPVSEGALR